jgi:hypothetical protein
LSKVSKRLALKKRGFHIGRRENARLKGVTYPECGTMTTNYAGLLNALFGEEGRKLAV